MRSWMFVPGSRPRMLDKALGLPVDAVIMDLEDAVTRPEKPAARGQVAATLDRIAARSAGAAPRTRAAATYVRTNAVGHEWMHADLAAVVRPGLDGLALPKVEAPEQVLEVARILEAREPAAGIPAGRLRLLVAIETPRGLLDAYAIAASSPRVVGLMFGAEDFSRALGLPMRREAEARELIYARSALVTAAAAAHVQRVDGVWVDLDDPEGLRQFAAQSRRLGFSGMALIHPSQIDAVNATFTPTPEEIEYCRQVVRAFEDAKASGQGAAAFGGQLLDAPIVERAIETLALAQSIS